MGYILRGVVLLWAVLCIFGGGFYLLFPKLKVWDNDFIQRNEAFQAVFSGNEVSLKEFIVKGGDVNTRSVLGLTPLHAACATGQIGKAMMLLRAGAQIDRRNWFGASPLSMAAMRGQYKLIEALFKGSTEYSSNGDNSNSDSNSNYSYYLSPNQRGWYGEGALHWALSSSPSSPSPSSSASQPITNSNSNSIRLATLKALVKAGADPLLRNYIGKFMKET